jgi:hypothetical protein
LLDAAQIRINGCSHVKVHCDVADDQTPDYKCL